MPSTPPHSLSMHNSFHTPASNPINNMPELASTQGPPSEAISHGPFAGGTSSDPPTDNDPQIPISTLATTAAPVLHNEVITAAANTGSVPMPVDPVMGAGCSQPATPHSPPGAPSSETSAQLTSQSYVPMELDPPSTATELLQDDTSEYIPDSQPTINMPATLAATGNSAPPSESLEQSAEDSDAELLEAITHLYSHTGAMVSNLVDPVPLSTSSASPTIPSSQGATQASLHATAQASFVAATHHTMANGGTLPGGSNPFPYPLTQSIPNIPNIPFLTGSSFGGSWGITPAFDAVVFVNSLEEVDISTIPAEDMRCPHCWLPFGATDEDDPSFTPDFGDDVEVTTRLMAFRELPDCKCKLDNTPVKTPCGHLFGKTCLIESLEKTNTRCPSCRHEFRKYPWRTGKRRHS